MLGPSSEFHIGYLYYVIANYPLWGSLLRNVGCIQRPLKNIKWDGGTVMFRKSIPCGEWVKGRESGSMKEGEGAIDIV